MNDESGCFFIGVITGLFIGAFIFSIAGFKIASNSYKLEAIRHGHARYDSVTGDWKWNINAESELTED